MELYIRLKYDCRCSSAGMQPHHQGWCAKAGEVGQSAANMKSPPLWPMSSGPGAYLTGRLALCILRKFYGRNHVGNLLSAAPADLAKSVWPGWH